MSSYVVLPRSRWQDLRNYSREVWDHMNGASLKQNDDGSYSVSVTRIKPDRIANALRRLFYLALTVVVTIIGQQSRSISQAMQEAFGPKAFAVYLRDPEVKAAFGELIREYLQVSAEQPLPTPMKGGRARPRTVPANRTPKGTSLALPDGARIVDTNGIFAYNAMPPWEGGWR